MHDMKRATAAYAAASAARDQRAQEADVFRYAIGMLKTARSGSRAAQARAIADNRLLWNTVADLMRDPSNALPTELRASILSLGHTVQREMDRPEPNMEFLIAVNESIAAGLSAAG